uniref:Ras-associating domain-containing protein n=1 Tax=Steinernema glaseri TaxID=37863 RepID=A0A1I7ZEM2_9BILA
MVAEHKRLRRSLHGGEVAGSHRYLLSIDVKLRHGCRCACSLHLEDLLNAVLGDARWGVEPVELSARGQDTVFARSPNIAEALVFVVTVVDKG